MKQRITRQRRNLFEVLCELGCCYRHDLAMYVDYTNGKMNSGTGLLRALSKSNLIAEREIWKQGNQGKYSAVTFSYAGKWLAIRNELYGTEDETKNRIEESAGFFNTHETEILQKRLLLNRISLAFKSVSVPSLPSEKPRLIDLYHAIGGKEENEKERINYEFLHADSDYKNMSENEINKLIETGVFYTIHEVRDFIEEFGGGSSDTTYRSRAKGLFLSNKICYIVYAPKRGKNRNLLISTRGEKRFLEKLEPLLNLTNVYRKLPSFKEKKLNYDGVVSDGVAPLNRPSALVIGDGSKMTFSLSHKHKLYDEEGNPSNKDAWLTDNQELFDEVFSVAFDAIGLDALSYLCNTTKEEWQEEMRTSFQANTVFKENSSSPKFLGLENKTGALMTYLPVYEINILETIRDADYPCGVLTYSDMMETISRIVGKKILYYDIETSEQIVLDDGTGQYDEYGQLAGIAKINIYLESEGLQAKRSDINKLPKQYDMNPEEFFNKVADGRIEIKEVVALLETEPKKLNRYKRQNEHFMVSCDLELKRQVKDAARLYGISISKYIRQLITEKVTEDASTYQKQLKEDKKIRKQAEGVSI